MLKCLRLTECVLICLDSCSKLSPYRAAGVKGYQITENKNILRFTYSWGRKNIYFYLQRTEILFFKVWKLFFVH